MYTNITHEFRTPLTVILGMNDVVHQFAEKIENHKIFRASEMIKRNGRNLLDLINQLLDLSKLQSGKLQLNYQSGNVIGYLKYLMESFQSYAEEKDIHLKFSSDQNQLIMDFDKEKLNHIMSNLVSNAIKYTPQHGKVNVLVSTEAGRHNQLELKITDNGQGIAPDQISKIFDRFYQGDSISIRQVEGTGIGLYLVRELVHLLEGSIQVQSTLGEGTEFTVCLPITNHSIIEDNPHLEDTSKKKFEKIEAPVPETTSKEKDIPLLLIVEDNPDIAHYIGTALRSVYRTVFAKNGNEGIEKAIDIIPDLIISDVMMPEKDGFELCKILKRDERTSHIPIIILTAKANAESKIEGLELGADAYLAKPFDKKELLIRIKNLLNVRAVMQKRFSKNDFSKIIKKDTAHLDKFLIKTKDAILLNIENEDFGIANLCKALNISRAQLHRKLVALTGHSASHLIRSIRLERAQELLLTRSLNISEVAYKVGFKTQAHFSRTFSEAMGITPSEFQNK